MSETQEYQDPNDIFRDIDLDNQDDVNEENIRLVKKRKAYRSSYLPSDDDVSLERVKEVMAKTVVTERYKMTTENK